jgi:hypothetical protein
MPQIPLPPRDMSPLIELRGLPKKEQRPEILAGRAKAIARLRESSFPAVTDARWHPCTKRTEKALNEAQPTTEGAFRARGIGVTNVRVWLEVIPRALAIPDEVVRRLEKLGHSISSGDPADLSINGVLVPFEISERFLRTDAPPDNAELARRVVFRERFPVQYGPEGRIMDLPTERQAKHHAFPGPREGR